MNTQIVHIITTIDLGGAEKQLLTLVESQRQSGAKVQVIYLKNQPLLLDEFRKADIEVLTSFSRKSLIRQFFLLRKFRQTGVVYHAHLPRSELLCALALRPRSFVVTRHNSESFFPRAPKFLSRALSRMVLKRAFACISISHSVKNFLKISKEAPASTNIIVVPYGLRQLLSQGREFSKSTNSEIFKIGTASRLVPQKNIPLLLQAMYLLKAKQHYKFHLFIAGTGPLESKLQAMSIRLKIDKNITWIGKISAIEEFYKQIDVFVLSSNYEGFGLVLLEAMSYGIPVIARNVSAIPEVLGKKHPGLLRTNRPEDLASKIEEFLLHEQARNNCLEHQSHQLAKFSITKTRSSHDELYKRLLADSA